MIYRNLPGFMRPLPLVTFGGASVSGEGGGYGFGEMGESEAEALLKKAYEEGITLFDTAPIYGFGLSEERFGKYLPKEAMIISKSGVDWHESKRVNRTNDPKVTERMLGESLKRLNREFIDIYMIHWPDESVDIRLPLEVLKKAQDAGKILKIGLCNTTVSDLEKAGEVCNIDVIQSELNLFNQEPFDRLGNAAKETFTMSWGTFDKGILSGRVTHDRKYEASDARSWAPWWNKKEVAQKIDKITHLKKILEHHHITLPEFCLQYNLHYYGVGTCLIGFKKIEDIMQVKTHVDKSLSREKIEKVLSDWKNHLL